MTDIESGKDWYRQQFANPAGGYYEDRFNGTYLGFVGGQKIDYTVIVRVDEPKIKGYAGSKAAAPILRRFSEHVLLQTISTLTPFNKLKLRYNTKNTK